MYQTGQFQKHPTFRAKVARCKYVWYIWHMSQIYLIEFTNGALYIGSSIRPKTRHYEHIRDLKKGTHHSAYLQRSYDKGYDFSFIVLQETEINDPQELQRLEAVWISAFDAIHSREFANTQQPLGLDFGTSARSKRMV